MSVSLKSNALITEAELEQFLQDSLATDFANTLINYASDLIENITGRKWILQTYTDEDYDGNGERIMYLKNFPITAVTAIKAWDTVADAVFYTYTENSEYLIYLEEGYIYMRGGWTKGHQNFKITYSAGYAIANVPYDIKKACAELCAFAQNLLAKAGYTQESIGNYSYSKESLEGVLPSSALGIPAAISAALRRHRINNI